MSRQGADENNNNNKKTELKVTRRDLQIAS
jgi:hypothetical protein